MDPGRRAHKLAARRHAIFLRRDEIQNKIRKESIGLSRLHEELTALELQRKQNKHQLEESLRNTEILRSTADSLGEKIQLLSAKISKGKTSEDELTHTLRRYTKMDQEIRRLEKMYKEIGWFGTTLPERGYFTFGETVGGFFSTWWDLDLNRAIETTCRKINA